MIDAAVPIYQWTMLRFNGQSKPYENSAGQTIMSLEPGTVWHSPTQIGYEPYEEMWPPANNGAAGKMKEVQLIVGFDDAAAIASPHTLHIPMRYATNLIQP
ncbi:MAG TPA: hypothetical protein VNT03_09480 [Baekduia sp.]|nr:hypothetical protein [Baekduia sp.]